MPNNANTWAGDTVELGGLKMPAKMSLGAYLRIQKKQGNNWEDINFSDPQIIIDCLFEYAIDTNPQLDRLAFNERIALVPMQDVMNYFGQCMDLGNKSEGGNPPQAEDTIEGPLTE